MTEILYIEDNEFDRVAFQHAMEVFKGMRITYSEDIANAKELLNKNTYSLIICDFNLPDGNAFDILDLRIETPVIVLTGQGDDETAVKAIQKGAKDYLFKDFSSKHLSMVPVIIEKTLKMAEAERAEARLAAIVESAGDAIFTMDIQNRIITWNHGAEEIYGFTNQEAIGKTTCELLCNGRCDEIKQMVEYVHRSHTTALGEFEHTNKSGEKILVYMSMSPVWDTAGNISCYSMISRDVTELKKKQKQLARQEDELKRSKEIQQQKDEFIGIASHELKTPLTSLKAYIQLLEKQVKSYREIDPARFVSSIEKTSQHIEKLELLINDLFSISRIQAGKLSYNIRKFSFDELVKETIESVSKICEDQPILLEGSTETDIEGDRIRLEEVISNYLTNAIKFSPEKKPIKVIIKRIGQDVEVCVKDQGVGISKKDLEHIFKRYYRSKENSYKFPGLGIGLYISREIVNRHHGRSWVESEKGKGSEFYFSIPVVQPEHNGDLHRK